MHVFSKIAQMRKTAIPLKGKVQSEAKHLCRLNLLTKTFTTARKQSAPRAPA
jgi:hypothetical protein